MAFAVPGSAPEAAACPAAGAAVLGAGRRRIEKRVTARTNATSRAARPASWAPTTGALSGRAEVSAAWRAFALNAEPDPELELGVGDGLSVGNRPEALPPGLRVAPVVGLVVETPGSVPIGSGDVDGVGCATGTDPLIATVAEALGSLGRLAALPITVSRTDFTVDAVDGTMDSAWSCRWADFASIAPRSQEDVPLLLPQPKLNCGVTSPGVACSRTVALGTLPPLVQALITHCEAAPRLLLAWELVIWTQRLIFAACWTDCAPVPVGLDVPEGKALAVGEAVERERAAVADGDGDEVG